MIDPSDRCLSISRQSELLGVSRSHHYYKPRPECWEDIEEKAKLKELFLKYPFYGLFAVSTFRTKSQFLLATV